MLSLLRSFPPISFSRSSLRLRYWALMQIGHDLLYQPPDTLPDSVREEWRTLLTGHLNGRFFRCAGLEYPELRQMGEDCLVNPAELEFLTLVAEMMLDGLAESNPDASGFLAGYVREAKRNLAACPTCVRLVGETLCEEGRLAAALDTLKAWKSVLS